MSGARPKGRFWREVKYTEQEWTRTGMKIGRASHPRRFTPAQMRRMEKKDRTNGLCWGGRDE